MSFKLIEAPRQMPDGLFCSPGWLSLLRDGDMVRVCVENGELLTDADLSVRTPAPDPDVEWGVGRELFRMLQSHADGAEKGASAMLASAGL